MLLLRRFHLWHLLRMDNGLPHHMSTVLLCGHWFRRCPGRCMAKAVSLEHLVLILLLTESHWRPHSSTVVFISGPCRLGRAGYSGNRASEGYKPLRLIQAVDFLE